MYSRRGSRGRGHWGRVPPIGSGSQKKGGRKEKRNEERKERERRKGNKGREEKKRKKRKRRKDKELGATKKSIPPRHIP